MLDRALRRLGVEPRPFRALLAAFVAMDLRGHNYERSTGSRPGALVPPLFWVVGQLLLASGLLSAFLYARVDAWFFACASLAASMLLVFSAVVVEFREAALNPADPLVVGHRPVPPRTYAAARLANLLFFVLLLTTALAIFPAILGAGLRDAGPWFLPAYLVAALLGNLAVAAVTVLLSAVLVRDETQQLLAWTQVALIVVVFYGAQLALRDASGSFELFAARPPAWLRALPPAWLAWFVATAPGWTHAAFALAAVAAVGGVCAAAAARLSTAYARASRRALVVPAPVRTSRRDEAALGFLLTRTLLRRDPDFRARTWPALGTALAAVAVGLLSGQWTDPMRVAGPTSVLPLAVIPLLASAVPLAVFNLSFSRDHEAAWLLRTAPLAQRARFVAGARRALLRTLFLPVVVALFAVFWWSWRDALHAAVHAGIAWLVVEGAARVSFVVALADLPFSRPLRRGATMGPVLLVAAWVAGGAGLLALVHYHAARAPLALALYVGLLGAAVAALHRWSVRRA